jgi:hypothetical protein
MCHAFIRAYKDSEKDALKKMSQIIHFIHPIIHGKNVYCDGFPPFFPGKGSPGRN